MSRAPCEFEDVDDPIDPVACGSPAIGGESRFSRRSFVKTSGILGVAAVAHIPQLVEAETADGTRSGAVISSSVKTNRGFANHIGIRTSDFVKKISPELRIKGLSIPAVRGRGSGGGRIARASRAEIRVDRFDRGV